MFFWPQTLNQCRFLSFQWIFMGPKYVLRHFSKFRFLQKFRPNDRNFCHLSHLSNSHFLLFFQFSRGTSRACRNFWEAKLGKSGQLGVFCPKNNKNSSNVEKWWFLTILKFGSFLKIFDPQLQIFKNTPMAAEISDDPKFWLTKTLGPKKSPSIDAR